MLVIGFSLPSRLPGLPFQHPQREPLRQIGEDYGLSQGPHWELREASAARGRWHPLILSAGTQLAGLRPSWRGRAGSVAPPVWTLPAEGAETHTSPQRAAHEESLWREIERYGASFVCRGWLFSPPRALRKRQR